MYVVGNTANNVITAGLSGGTLDGGAGNDRLVGNSAASIGSTFIYTVGEGKDELTGYNGNLDTIVLKGYGEEINTTDTKIFKDTGKDITLKLSNETASGTLSIKNPQGKLTIVDENKNTLLSYGENLPDPAHMSFNSSKTLLTVGSDATLGSVNTLKLKDYGITLKELDASAYSTTGLHLIASPGKSNILRAGGAASTLQGNSGSDKLYGGGSSDTFVYSVGGGKDEVYNFDGAEGDEILLVNYTGTTIVASDTKVFKDTGKDITLMLNSTSKLTLKSPTGKLNVYGATINESTGAITKGSALLTYDTNLPSGVEYNQTKTVLTIDSSTTAATTIDASESGAYSNMLKTINASTTSVNVALTGNKNANDIYAGKTASTLNGSDGNDRLYGMTGGKDVFVYDHTSGNAGKDIVYNYNAAEGDVISVSSAVVSGGMKVTYNGKTLVLTYSDKINGTNVNGTLTINGQSLGGTKYANIDSATTVALQVGTAPVKYYRFISNKIKNVMLEEAVDKDSATTVASAAASSQLPTTGIDDYWFTSEEKFDSADEIGEILAIEPLATQSEEFDELTKLGRDLDKAFVSTDLNRQRKKQ